MPPPEFPHPDTLRKLLRPFILTGGRARPVSGEELEIEALVATTGLGMATPPAAPEHRSIALLCHQMQSIAEVAAHLGVPIGVIRVLIADMAHQGLVELYRPSHPSPRTNIRLLERLLEGLHKI